MDISNVNAPPMLESTTYALVVENSITIDDLGATINSRAITNLGAIDDLGRIVNSSIVVGLGTNLIVGKKNQNLKLVGGINGTIIDAQTQ